MTDFRREYDSAPCPRCGRYVRVRRDGSLAKHRDWRGQCAQVEPVCDKCSGRGVVGYGLGDGLLCDCQRGPR